MWFVYLHYSVYHELDKYLGFIKTVNDSTTYSHVFYLPKGNDRWSELKKEYASAFGFSFRHILANRIPDKLQFYHTGRCGYCGRPLTDPESMARGIGPTCLKHLGL